MAMRLRRASPDVNVVVKRMSFAELLANIEVPLAGSDETSN